MSGHTVARTPFRKIASWLSPKKATWISTLRVTCCAIRTWNQTAMLIWRRFKDHRVMIVVPHRPFCTVRAQSSCRVVHLAQSTVLAYSKREASVICVTSTKKRMKSAAVIQPQELRQRAKDKGKARIFRTSIANCNVNSATAPSRTSIT